MILTHFKDSASLHTRARARARDMNYHGNK